MRYFCNLVRKAVVILVTSYTLFCNITGLSVSLMVVVLEFLTSKWFLLRVFFFFFFKMLQCPCTGQLLTKFTFCSLQLLLEAVLFLQPHFLRSSALSHLRNLMRTFLTANLATSPVLQISVDRRTALTTGSSCCRTLSVCCISLACRDSLLCLESLLGSACLGSYESSGFITHESW